MTKMLFPVALLATTCLAVPATALAGSCSSSKTATTAQAAGSNLVETAREAGQFKTLLAAVEAAGLAETLQGSGPFTIFAPTDAAFAALPAGTVEALLADKAKLTAVLTYHVVAGKVMAADLAHVRTARTVEGSSIDLALEPSPRVNGANIVKADVAASNGVIHVIDSVILPPASSAAGAKS